MKQSAWQPEKNLQGVLAKVVQQDRQVTDETKCSAAPKNLQSVMARVVQHGRQVTDEREFWAAPLK